MVDRLEEMTVKKLREEARKYPNQIVGAHAMKKDELINALRAVREEKEGTTKLTNEDTLTQKTELKKKIKILKNERDGTLTEHDRETFVKARKKIKALKRKLRKINTLRKSQKA